MVYLLVFYKPASNINTDTHITSTLFPKWKKNSKSCIFCLLLCFVIWKVVFAPQGLSKLILWIEKCIEWIYRVSQKKVPHVLRGHNSPKNGTKNKSRVSFEILRSSAFWWALKFFIFDHGGLRKLGLKRVTLYLKTWPN